MLRVSPEGVALPDPIILLVDDDRFIRVAMRDTLEGRGYGFLEAEHGDAALEQLQSASPALVILDLFMPQRSGLDTLGEIRRLHPNLPVLVVSSLDAESMIEEAFKLGATDFISKPFHPVEIAEAVARIVRA